MGDAHTYDKWQELGYQVNKGEKAAYKMYGRSIFTREQVSKIGYQKKHYENHCWKCRSDVDSNYEDECFSCGWLECPSCGSCRCNMPR